MDNDNQSLPPKKPRALTYSEMMNGGRAQMDEQTHERELEWKRRKTDLERDVNHLEQSFKVAD
jgi:hypothetical protein